MDGYDLDLCFITNRVIAMSFPSSGFTALYRNAIGDVAQFLNGRHGTNYRIYNLCDEKTYPTDLFTGEVVHFPIVDHNVPALYRMTQFARESREYLRANPEHILVVHCRGGKGRTGSMICLHLIDVGVFQSAAECLNYFGMRRTDLSLSSKFQGVDTPSQSRYVEYFGSIVDQYEREMPPSPEIYLESLTINNLPAKYLDEKFQLCCEVWSYREEQLTEMIMIGSFKWTNQQTQTTSETPSSIVIGPSENQTLAMKGDVKIKFTSNKLPKGYDHCSFFFWFHTFWIKDNKLHLDRDVIDNPHKKKFWKYYPPEFSIDICFSQ